MMTKHFLVCYDIRNPKRLNRIGRVSRKHAVSLQYSVFYISGSEQDLDRFLLLLEQEMDEREDDVRAYQIPDVQRVENMGQSWLPDGIFI